MVERGLLAHIGAHGEPPLGLNYHAEMFFTREGGLSNYEARVSSSLYRRLLRCTNPPSYFSRSSEQQPPQRRPL